MNPEPVPSTGQQSRELWQEDSSCVLLGGVFSPCPWISIASIAPSGVALSAWRHTERHRKREGDGHDEAVGYCSQTLSLRTF